MRQDSFSIDVFPVANLHDMNEQHIVLDLVNDSIIVLPDSVAGTAGQLLAILGPWIGGKSLDSLINAFSERYA